MIEIVASIRMHTHTHNQPPHEDARSGSSQPTNTNVFYILPPVRGVYISIVRYDARICRGCGHSGCQNIHSKSNFFTPRNIITKYKNNIVVRVTCTIRFNSCCINLSTKSKISNRKIASTTSTVCSGFCGRCFLCVSPIKGMCMRADEEVPTDCGLCGFVNAINEMQMKLNDLSSTVICMTQ